MLIFRYAFSVSIEPHMGSTWVQYYFPHCTDDLPDYDPGEINILNRDQVGCDDSIGPAVFAQMFKA